MLKGSDTLDLTGGHAENGVYDMPGACDNCSWSGTLVLPKGRKRPQLAGMASDTRVQCPNCGCRSVSARA